MTFVPLRRTPLRERASVLFVERGQIDVDDQAFVVVDVSGRTQIPLAGITALRPSADGAHYRDPAPSTTPETV